MEPKAIGKNLVFYVGEHVVGQRRVHPLFIKVTDYKDRCWAETPLSGREIQEMIKFFEEYLTLSGEGAGVR